MGLVSHVPLADSIARRPVGLLPLVRLPLIWPPLVRGLALVHGLALVELSLVRLAFVGLALVWRLTLVLTRILLPVRVPWRLAHVSSPSADDGDRTHTSMGATIAMTVRTEL